ncbi:MULTISPECIES: HTH-type transcriptional regulator BhcR [unclassified Paracoccus (in: a-proteobacteria)]|uniref:HTH-type transcriptional regulator BhcR n=1 Tax=unclassified Paracoccus (in: a-proteobacteria) TaxID=2688777 RepID=UPI0012B1D633|nr:MULTISPECIES: HTH-type transcriptional regulator BhcR [unclassified Paracoccus (in: a-proteobacteria)]UXU76468.1 IclR family transcriptional regulator [Paracoccus sp. SMMA_5]UXU82194.1 IclR family transcriptional regulator [Paracoccus sp. SMMA_5_TC]
MSAETRKRGRPRGRVSTIGNEDTGGIRALDRALDILDLIAGANGLTLTEIAQRLEMAPSTVHRVLVTLATRGVTESDPLTQAWHIGPTAFRHGSAFMRRSGLVERARPVLRRLMEVTGETANLGILNGDAVLFLSQAETHETIRAFFPPGTRSALHASGIGKALLAHANPTALKRMIAEMKLERFTEMTLVDPQALMQDLAEIRARGYSLDNEERTPGMRCIAAPIFDLAGEAAAGISVSGPTLRMHDARLVAIADAVIDAAKELSFGMAPDSAWHE